jgi:hypothetical protein
MMVGPPSDSNVSGRLFLCKNLKELVTPMVDVKELIFLIVFVVIIAVPLILSVLKKKKNGGNGEKKDKT